MARYAVWVEVIDQFGTRSPRHQRVSWSARRTADPAVLLGGDKERDYDHVSERSGVLSGYYTCIKDAESRNETIAVDDIDLTIERVQEHLKRGKVDRVQRSSSKLTGHFRDVFDEVMARPRPLK